ncbi:UNVERIFIED_CONTAM: hypothetical protein K2H54_064822 [Gekko kuhli]
MLLLVLVLMLLLLLLPHNVACGVLKAKCPLNLIKVLDDPWNYFKPGDHLIGGIVSLKHTYLHPILFDEPPHNKFKQSPKEENQYLGIVKLLLCFQWTWIGLIAVDTDNGEQFMRIFPTVARKSGVCVAFSLSFPVTALPEDIVKRFLCSDAFHLWRKVSVLVYYGEPQAFPAIPHLIQRTVEDRIKPPVGKIWITTALWDLTLSFHTRLLRSDGIHGFVSFSIRTKKRIKDVNYRAVTSAIRQFVKKAFGCFYPKTSLSVKAQVRCRERENLEAISQDVKETIHSLDSFSSFNAIFNVAWALHAAYSSRLKQMLSRDRLGLQRFHTFLRNVPLYNTSTGEAYWDVNGDVGLDFNIVTWMGFPNGSVLGVKVGSVESQASSVLKLTIDNNALVFPLRLNQLCINKSGTVFG